MIKYMYYNLLDAHDSSRVTENTAQNKNQTFWELHQQKYIDHYLATHCDSFQDARASAPSRFGLQRTQPVALRDRGDRPIELGKFRQ